jgi:hypothetical protein
LTLRSFLDSVPTVVARIDRVAQVGRRKGQDFVKFFRFFVGFYIQALAIRNLLSSRFDG